jgi:hypothetical protein
VSSVAESLAPLSRAPLPQLRLVFTRALLLSCWRSALDAASNATETAFEQKALDSAERRGYEQRLHAERDWLGTFERESARSFP